MKACQMHCSKNLTTQNIFIDERWGSSNFSVYHKLYGKSKMWKCQRENCIPLWLHETLPQNQRITWELHLPDIQRSWWTLQIYTLRKMLIAFIINVTSFLSRTRYFRKCLLQCSNKVETQKKIYKDNIAQDQQTDFVCTSSQTLSPIV